AGAERFPGQHVDATGAKGAPEEHLDRAGVRGRDNANAIVSGNFEQFTGEVDGLLDAGLGRLGAMRAAGQSAGKRVERPTWTLGAWPRREIRISRFNRRCGVGRISHLQRPSQAYASRVRARCPEAGNTPETDRRQWAFASAERSGLCAFSSLVK